MVLSVNSWIGGMSSLSYNPVLLYKQQGLKQSANMDIVSLCELLSMIL